MLKICFGLWPVKDNIIKRDKSHLFKRVKFSDVHYIISDYTSVVHCSAERLDASTVEISRKAKAEIFSHWFDREQDTQHVRTV